MRRRIRLAAIAAAFLASCVGAPATTQSTAVPATTAQAIAAATKPPVVVVVYENHSYSQIVGSPNAPYINQQLIPKGKLFTNFWAATHPSLPNYLVMTSGGTDGKTTDSVTFGQVRYENLFHQLSVRGSQWRTYAQSMPSSCYTGTSSGPYVLRHNPALTFYNVAHGGICGKDRPFPIEYPLQGRLTFVIPDNRHNMHDNTVESGDQYLSELMPPLLATGAEVYLTFDEGDSDVDNHIATIGVGPGVRAGSRDGTRYDLYGLCAGLANYFGLPKLQQAQTAVPVLIGA
jgi:hypothetical protein